jgi:predicted nucleic acid-binding protein
MILVDTSVWIRFLGNQAPYAKRMDALLDLGEVAGHDLVYGELLISNQPLGDRGGRAKLLAGYEKMHQASLVPHGDVVAFVRSRSLHGRGLGWIDVHLLASAIVGRLGLWTANQSLASLAGEFGVAWRNS